MIPTEITAEITEEITVVPVELTECTKCEGSGVITRSRYLGPYYDQPEYKCHICDGEGLIEPHLLQYYLEVKNIGRPMGPR